MSKESPAGKTVTPKTAKSAAARGQLADTAGPLLSLIIVLRRTPSLDSLSDLRNSVEKMILEFRSKLRDLGTPPQDIDDATYAIAATFDETLLNARWAGRDDWERKALAKTYCDDEFVGLGFFDKLTQLRRSSSPKRDVIEVFYFCLVSGFQGKLVETPAQLSDLVDEISKEIATPEKAVSVNAYPDKAGRLEPIRNFPWPIVLVVGIFVPLLVWLIAWNIIDRHADKISRAFAGN